MTASHGNTSSQIILASKIIITTQFTNSLSVVYNNILITSTKETSHSPLMTGGQLFLKDSSLNWNIIKKGLDQMIIKGALFSACSSYIKAIQ